MNVFAAGVDADDRDSTGHRTLNGWSERGGIGNRDDESVSWRLRDEVRTALVDAIGNDDRPLVADETGFTNRSKGSAGFLASQHDHRGRLSP